MQIFTEIYFFKACAVRKSIRLNRSHAAGDIKMFKICAVFKSILTYGGCILSNDDICKSVAIGKTFVADIDKIFQFNSTQTRKRKSKRINMSDIRQKVQTVKAITR